MMMVSMIAVAAGIAAQPSASIPTHAVKIDLIGPSAPPPVPNRRLALTQPSSSLPRNWDREPPPLPTASPSAQTLAAHILDRVGLLDLIARGELERSLQPYYRDPPPCDPANDECRRIGQELVAQETPRTISEMREAWSRILGAHFDRTMGASEIGAALRFVDSPAGQAFAGSLTRLNEIDRSYGSYYTRILERHSRALAAEYDRRTAHLPRRAPTPLPTPPSPPPPPPAPHP